jgi:hypothetical protein
MRKPPAPHRLTTHGEIVAALGPGGRGVVIAPDGRLSRIHIEEGGIIFLYGRRSCRWGRRLYLDAGLPQDWRVKGGSSSTPALPARRGPSPACDALPGRCSATLPRTCGPS